MSCRLRLPSNVVSKTLGRGPRTDPSGGRGQGSAPRQVARLSSFDGAVALLCLTAFGCQAPPPRWNVLLVSLDTTRADHIGCYGDEQARTPNIDALASRGVLFEDAVAPAPITLPSHSSLMTGKLPLAHGVRDNGLFVLGEQHQTMAESLRDRGYRTAAAIASYPLQARFGIGQGFELFDDHITASHEDLFGQKVFPKSRLYFDERQAGDVNEAIWPWLEEHHEEPFFLWLHYFDAHQPLEPPPPYDQIFAHDPYRGEIAYADESIGTVLQRLDDLGVRERTLVIVTADHGEGLGEHREATHSMLLYQSTLHVPLIIAAPQGVAGGRVEERVSLVDVLPTVLELLEIEIPTGVQGRSLAHHLTGANAEPPSRQREVYAETLSPRLARNWGELRALFVGDHKYVHGPRPELYDLASDPREQHDLVAEQPEVASGLRVRLERFVRQHAVEGLDASTTLDDEGARQLQALGYLHTAGQSAGRLHEELRADGEPPQDHVDTISAYSQAKAEVFAGRLVAAKDLLLDLLDDDPDNPNYLEMLADLEMQAGRPTAALAVLERMIAVAAPHPPLQQIHDSAARVLLALGRPQPALAHLEQAQGLERTADRAYLAAISKEQLGDPTGSRAELEQALALDPSLVAARIDVAISYVRSGDLGTAEKHFRLAVEQHPFDVRAHYNLGAFLVQLGSEEEAVRHFERAVKIDPGYLPAHYARFERLHAAGDWARATESFEAIHRLAPNSEEARMARALMEVEP